MAGACFFFLDGVIVGLAISCSDGVISSSEAMQVSSNYS
jgi:hypothetical protein